MERERKRERDGEREREREGERGRDRERERGENNNNINKYMDPYMHGSICERLGLLIGRCITVITNHTLTLT